MVKVTHKRKSNNKQGVILITVLFILAVAMIFIATAILMTNGTRTRVYNRAEANQSRLTVTSVAESFYAALQMQEISDADIEALANADKTIRITSDTLMPGLTNSDNNCTDVHFYVKEGKIIGEFVTTIDGHSDKVKMTLNKQERKDPPNSFVHQVEVYGGGKLWELNVGMGGEGKPDNTIFAHGDAGTSRGSTNYYSTFITTGVFMPGSGTTFHSDVVFLKDGASAGLSVDGAQINGNCFTLYDNANMYFIDNTNPTTGNISFDWLKVSGDGSTSTVYYSTAGNLVNYKNNGNIKADVVSAISGNPAKWTEYKNLSTTSAMDTWSACAAAYGLDISCNPSGDDVKTFSESQLDAERKLKAGTYKITGDVNLSNGNVKCDLSSGDYYFYITNNCTICKGFFEFSGTGYHAYFIIATGKHLSIVPNAAGGSEDFCGIVDTNVYDMTNHKVISGKAVPNVFVFGAGTGEDAETNLKKILDEGEAGGAAAQVALYGNGKDGSANAVITALVGLYQKDGSSNDYGSFWSKNSTGNAFYGRIAAYSVYNRSGGNLDMPYCPAPSNKKDADTYYRTLTEYHVLSMEYYYT